MLQHPLLTGGRKFNPARVSASAWFDGAEGALSIAFAENAESSRFLLSFWLRRTEFSVAGTSPIFGTGEGSNAEVICFDADDRLCVTLNSQTHVSDRVFRDTVWYHFVVSVERGGSPDASVYVNGEAITWGTDVSLSADPGWFDSTNALQIGCDSAGNHGAMYLAQVTGLPQVSIQNGDHAIGDFGEYWPAGGNGVIWSPQPDEALVLLANAAGGNAFCLTANIGDGTDASANENDFTPSGMLHSVNGSANTPSQSYPLISPLNPDRGSHVLGEGNQAVSSAGLGGWSVTDTAFPAAGHFYAEFAPTASVAAAPDMGVGVVPVSDLSERHDPAVSVNAYGYNTNGSLRNNNATSTYGEPYTDADVISIVVYSGTLHFMKNGVDQGEAATGLAGDYLIVLYDGSLYNLSGRFRFIATEWTGTPPAGARAVCSETVAEPVNQGRDCFGVVAYTGNGVAIGSGGHAIAGMGFQPDLVVTKERGDTNDNQWYDRLTGLNEQLQPNENTAAAIQAEGLSAFDVDGFTTGSHAEINNDSDTYIAFGWKAGGAVVANDDGSASALLSLAKAGHLSLARYSGTGSAKTIGHGLVESPDLVIVKDISGAFSWQVWSPFLSSTLHYLNLNTSAGESSSNGIQRWNDTAPTSSVVSVGTASSASGRDYVMTCFRSVPGVCLAGAYTGNLDADGPWVPCGFKPRWLLTKRLDGSGHEWHVYDTERSPANPADKYIFLDQTAAEATGKDIDFLAGGFKIRTADADINSNGSTHIFIAMADVAGGGDLPPIPGA